MEKWTLIIGKQKRLVGVIGKLFPHFEHKVCVTHVLKF